MKGILFFTIYLIIGFSGLSQETHRFGLKFDDAAYARSPRLAVGRKATTTEPVVNLKPYTPFPGNQKNCSSCVGWAIGYSALTTCWAIKNKLTDRGLITAKANSAMYIFSQIAGDCDQASIVTDGIQLVKDQGDCLLSDFDPPVVIPVSQQLKTNAKPYRIKDFATLFDTEADAETKITETRNSIGAQKPVIIGINIYPSFNKITKTDKVWTPDVDNEEKLGGHALTVVGYNDYTRRFEIQNSWGKEWADDGYFQIGYDDYAKVCKYAFQVTLDDRNPTDKGYDIHGEFVLEKFTNWDERLQQPVFQSLTPQLQGGEYLLTGKNTKKDDRYRILAKNVKGNCYVYIFSIDPNKKGEVLYPFSKNQGFRQQYNLDAALVELPRVNSNEVVEIPGRNKAILTDVAGEDYMCILFAFNPINNIDQIVDKAMESNKPTFRERLHDAIGYRLIPEGSITYRNDVMGVNGSSATGDIVPIILKMQVQ